MTPKEKAIELYEKFYYQLPSTLADKVQDCAAQECALIVVDEVLKQQPYDVYTIEQCGNVNKYWQEVKQEIEKL